MKKSAHFSRLAVLLASLGSIALAGDEWQSPSLLPHSSHESTEPAYQLVGVEQSDGNCTAWVIADEALVHQQRSVNRIVTSVHKRVGELNLGGCSFSIHFYRAVHAEPANPSFRITEQLGIYDGSDNTTKFLGDTQHYGSWAQGPASLQPTQASTSR